MISTYAAWASDVGEIVLHSREVRTVGRIKGRLAARAALLHSQLIRYGPFVSLSAVNTVDST